MRSIQALYSLYSAKRVTPQPETSLIAEDRFRVKALRDWELQARMAWLVNQI